MKQALEHIDQLRPLLEDRPEFVIIERPGYIAIDYLYVDRDTFSDPLLLECRGVKFDPKGRIIARPFHKFFNLGEKQQEHEIDWSQRHWIAEKLDGSMIHPVMLAADALYLMTRKGNTDVAQQAERKFMHTSNYPRFCFEMLEKGYTPIFEYTSPNNRIVIPYTEHRLTLLALRETIEGGYWWPEDMRIAADKYGIPCAATTCGDATTTLTELAEVRKAFDVAGSVIRFADGHMLKVKADDYLMKHRAIDDLASKKKVLAVVLADAVDDVLPILNEIDRAALLEFRDQVNQEITHNVRQTEAFLERFSGEGRKEYAAAVQEHVNSPFQSVAFAAYDGKDPRAHIKNLFSKRPDLVSAQWRGE